MGNCGNIAGSILRSGKTSTARDAEGREWMYGGKRREDTRRSSSTHEPLIQQPGACCNASWGRGPMSVREHRYINPMVRGLWISSPFLSPLLPFVWEIKHRHKQSSTRFEVNAVCVSGETCARIEKKKKKKMSLLNFSRDEKALNFRCKYLCLSLVDLHPNKSFPYQVSIDFTFNFYNIVSKRF